MHEAFGDDNSKLQLFVVLVAPKLQTMHHALVDGNLELSLIAVMAALKP